jgi:hypothetical protein
VGDDDFNLFQPAILAGMAGSVAYPGRVITPGW